MLTFILKILLAHFIADFLLQSDKWVEDRNEKHYKSKFLYLHTLVHFAVLSVLFLSDFSTYFWAIISIPVCHFLIDLIKSYAEKYIENRKAALFIADQMLHLLVLTIVACLYFPYMIDFEFIFSTKLLSILLALLLATSVSGIIIKLFVEKWKLDDTDKTESLTNAGKAIGIIERLLIVIFIIAEMPEGIGFLLAAKSIFRFGDLSNAKDKKLTEYILLGTLMSFTLAIVIGFGLRFFLTSSLFE